MKSTYSSIPKEYAIDQTIAHTNYLIDGQIGTWDGNFAEVYSSIQTENEKGELGPTLLGTVPNMDEKAAELGFYLHRAGVLSTHGRHLSRSRDCAAG